MTALFDKAGKVARWPSKAAERKEVLDWLAAFFEPGRVYAEREVNDILNAHHTFGDWALLRRELFESRRLERNPRLGHYWVPGSPP
jgi:hypothetical protein